MTGSTASVGAALGTPTARVVRFVGGDVGVWRIERAECLAGTALAPATRLSVEADASAPASKARWTLRGTTSNERYTVAAEKADLVARQPSLGRPEAGCAALIALGKSPRWWALAQDERREILEAQSHHVAIGLRYLPAVARRLHHCRDLDADAPFDFLTWFEYAPGDASAFEELVAALRATPEWRYVDHEADLRLVRDHAH